MSVRKYEVRLRVAALGLGIAVSALGCRSIVGIDDLTVVASGGSGGDADTNGGQANGGEANGGTANGNASNGGSSGGDIEGGSGAAGRGGSGGAVASGGKGGAAGGSGGTVGGGGGAGQPTGGTGGGSSAGGGTGGGTAGGGGAPECTGTRGPCEMCCHTAHMTDGPNFDQYVRMCACQASTCESACPAYCAPGMPETGCLMCTTDLVKNGSCNALSQCDGDPNCAALSKCIEACP